MVCLVGQMVPQVKLRCISYNMFSLPHHRTHIQIYTMDDKLKEVSKNVEVNRVGQKVVGLAQS